MRVERSILAGAAVVGAVLASLAPGAFSPEAWLFGVFIGLAQSVAGWRVYRRSLARGELALGPALGSGFLRIAFLVVALAAGLAAGLPAAGTAWSVLMMYAAMMTAEIALVARMLTSRPLEAA